MRVRDSFPVKLVLYDADLNVLQSYTSIRIIADQDGTVEPNPPIYVRAYQRDGLDVNEVARFISTKMSGSRNNGRFTTSEGTWHYNKSGGCGCGDPLRKFVVPAADPTEF